MPSVRVPNTCYALFFLLPCVVCFGSRTVHFVWWYSVPPEDHHGEAVDAIHANGEAAALHLQHLEEVGPRRMPPVSWLLVRPPWSFCHPCCKATVCASLCKLVVDRHEVRLTCALSASVCMCWLQVSRVCQTSHRARCDSNKDVLHVVVLLYSSWTVVLQSLSFSTTTTILITELQFAIQSYSSTAAPTPQTVC